MDGIDLKNITQKDKEKEKQPTPSVFGFRINAKRKGDSQQIINSLASLPFLFVSLDPANQEDVVVLKIDSRDISNNPYIFSIIYFRKNSIDVLYTTIPSKSPKLRKLEIFSYLLNILNFCQGVYAFDFLHLSQIVSSVLDDTKEYFSFEYQELFSKYDFLKEEFLRLEKKYKSLEDSKKELEQEVYSLKSKNEELMLKLSNIEKYSDSFLSIKIQEWISEHNGEFNIVEFAKLYNVSEARVEQLLNKLVAEGYLEGKSV